MIPSLTNHSKFISIFFAFFCLFSTVLFGNQSNFIPIYPLNSSQLTTLVDSSSIVAGNFKIVEELNASNELEPRIRPVYQSNGNWLDAGSNQFYRTNSSYPTLSSVLSYISSNNINAVNTPSGDTISITAPTPGTTVTGHNDNLHVYISYQSNGGGYQTPTWAYRIDSGFPAYGSPHGGTQVVGTTNRNDIFNGLSHGQRQVNVALLDQNGNLHNPPITRTISVNYQSTTGGYQTPTGNYQSPTGNSNQPTSPNNQNNNSPIPILSASDGRVLIDQLNGKFRYRDLKNITVWTVSQSQGSWQIRTGFHDNTLGYSTSGALNQYPANLGTGTPYQIDSQGIYIWNPSAGALYYEIESVVNGMVTSDYYFGSTQTTSIGKSYMFINKSLAESFYASKNPSYTPTSTPSPAPTPQPTPEPVLLKPIVETVNFSINQRNITLNGKLVQSGSSNSSNDETLGFLISPIAKLDPLNSTTSKIISVLNGNENLRFLS